MNTPHAKIFALHITTTAREESFCFVG